MVGGQRNRYFYLSRSLKRIGKYVGRGNRKSIAKAVCDNDSLRSEVIVSVSRMIRKEVKKVCSKNHKSMLRVKSRTALESFTWDRVWSEIRVNAPILTSILKGTFASTDDSIFPLLCVAVSILLKVSNPQVNLVQYILSLVLKLGHATKQVL